MNSPVWHPSRPRYPHDTAPRKQRIRLRDGLSRRPQQCNHAASLQQHGKEKDNLPHQGRPCAESQLPPHWRANLTHHRGGKIEEPLTQ